ncbi:hypothetical protein DSO57_1032282 [Entomophthora muscae]|uniref:Uncharacterized protein n=1 Tax=Entomophthora muscae TaxID=34485 RepID=A0ACC2TBY1_9FUNG|nr:hypothetical protein DSO57_1032282 [Entomophthora muscae]
MATMSSLTNSKDQLELQAISTKDKPIKMIIKPYVDQSGQETAQLPVGSNPGSPEIDDPKQGKQKPANLSSVNT